MHRGRLALALFLLCAVALIGAQLTTSAPPNAGTSGPGYIPGEVLIKFNSSARSLDVAAIKASLGAADLNKFNSGALHWRLGPGLSVEPLLGNNEKRDH